MFDPKVFDDLARRLAEAVPPGMRLLQQDMEKNFRAVLQSAFSKLDLVSREEFDVQAAVLARTRAKLEQLEQQIAALEREVLDRCSAATKADDENHPS